MAYNSYEVPDYWKPKWNRPVTFESVSDLSGAPLDDGRGFLMWISGGVVRQGFVDTPGDWAFTGTCTSGSTVPITNFTAHALSCFRVGSGLYCILDDSNGNNTELRVWKADSASNPSPGGWTIHGTMQDRFYSSSSFSDPVKHTPGIPYVTGSTWVWLGITSHPNFSGTGGDRTKVYRSTDSGVTWSERTSISSGGLGADSGERKTSHIARDPATGYLYGPQGKVGGSGGTVVWRRSTDGGSTWSNIYSDSIFDWGGGPYPFMDDGTYMYGHTDPSGWKLVRFDDPDDPLNGHTAVSDSFPNLTTTGYAPHLICDDGTGTLYMFNSDQVLLIADTGWTVGHIGMG